MQHLSTVRGPVRVAIAALLLAAASPATAAAQQRDTIRLTLTRAIEMAQQSGAVAAQARETYEAARLRDDSYHGRLLPQLSLTGTVPNVNRSIIPVTQPDGSTLFVPQRQTESSLALGVTQRIPITGGNLSLSSDLTRIDRFGQATSRLWRSTPVQVSLQQNLFRLNTLTLDNREQSLRGTIAERQYVEAMEDAAATALGVFFDAFTADFAVRNATFSVALNDTLYNNSKGRYQVGRIGENDLLQSELALLRAQITLDGARLQKERSLAALRIAFRIPADVPIELVPPAEIPVLTVDTTQAIAEALRNRSQVLDLDLQELQAQRRVADARTGGGIGATVTASAGFNQSGPLVDDVYHSLLQQQRFGLSVQVPLFLGGARSADIQAVQADQRRTTISVSTTRETLVHEVRFAALEIQLSKRQVIASAKADTVSQLRAESSKNRYLIGRIPINEFYQAQTDRENSSQQYMQTLRAYWQAYYRLRRLTLFDFATGTRLIRAGDTGAPSARR
jgi:outer membrane protein TolC